MTSSEVIRAWKDPEYRSNLSESEISMLPENPAGQIELSGSQLRNKFLVTTFVDSCVRPPVQCP
jgi:mersacidin/lichenicidin family type 2 lantibiotic